MDQSIKDVDLAGDVDLEMLMKEQTNICQPVVS